MKRQTSAWDRSSQLIRDRDRWFERFWIFGLLLAALLLFGLNLGYVPLRDGGEGTLAQVAREIARAPADSWRWLFPTLHGEPYFATPPLVPNLIAAGYPSSERWTWLVRLPGAVLAALSVPLLYGLGRELFPTRLPALLAALLYLTFYPVLRQGRLAETGGAVLCLMVLALWSALRSRRDWRWLLGLGSSLGLLGLAHGGAALLVAAIAFAFLAWDTPRLLQLPLLWGGLLLGLLPALVWYAAQFWRYGDRFATAALAAPLLAIVQPTADGSLLALPLLGELATLLPSLLFCLLGIPAIWAQRHWGWGKLSCLWLAAGGVAIAASLLHLHANLLLVLYPALALAGGAKLAAVQQQPSTAPDPSLWSWGSLCLGLAATGGCLALSLLDAQRAPLVVLAAIALTLGVVAMLLARRDPQFIVMLIWGLYVSLLLLASSAYWLGQLPPPAAVRPAAAVLRYATPADQPVYASLTEPRSALEFYSDRRVIPATAGELRRHWRRQAEPYLLLDAATLAQLELSDLHRLARAYPDWTLVTKAPATETPATRD